MVFLYAKPKQSTRHVEDGHVKCCMFALSLKNNITGKTEQNFTPLLFNWMGKELPFGSLFVLKFSLLSDSIGIYDSKYPKANNHVENSVMIRICG